MKGKKESGVGSRESGIEGVEPGGAIPGRVVHDDLRGAILEQVGEVLDKKLAAVVVAAREGLRDYLLASPERKAEKYKHAITIKVTFLPGYQPGSVKAKMKSPRPAIECETEQPAFVQLELFGMTERMEIARARDR